ncbi:hypothetical protein C3747_12g351 [Trypanosoma cruzi]|uniref:Uncharacterized protein n=2 Tax=Trypanosoma cruzi TaxID=5693 RepID=Q4DM54_TRYCC|nr:hypothetical protein, conserved [Trypanosoma cruzi]EAN93594.1 hypothetical protein, conserved [Trypanosoma cruzi]PWV18822.1 hypothetical protein C3747_12g351 [Trypanosoma cruzi]|eukprot:XP_815445.1 hypothetical protein [Trypanosoma cruzi strain CL Brener]
MELDLDAVSQVLERFLGTSSSQRGSLPASKVKASKRTPSQPHGGPHGDSFHRDDGKRELKAGTETNQENFIEKDCGTQEMLFLPREKKQRQKQQEQHCKHHKPSTNFVISSNQVLCRVVEASGLGASAVLLSTATTGKRREDRAWTSNLNQNPHPFVVLKSLSKNYLRKEIFSHVTPTTNSTATRIERVRDIALSIVFDDVVDAAGEAESPIERLVVSCSNHPRTGYVSVLRVKEIEGFFIRAVIPGSLMGPFMKLTLFPRDAIRVKVLRVRAIELAFADSWTERRIIEEPLSFLSEEENEEEARPMDPISFPQEVHEREKVGEDYPGSVPTPQSVKDLVEMVESSLASSTVPISSVETALGDGESVLDAYDLQKQFERTKSVKLAPVLQATREKAGASEMQPQNGARGAYNMAPIKSSDFKAMNSRVGSVKGSNEILPVASNTFLAHDLGLIRRNKNSEERKTAPHFVSIGEGDCTASKAHCTETEIGRKNMSKALIAWSIKRRLLQDKKIMSSLQAERDTPYDVASFDFVGQQEIRGTHKIKFDSQSHGVFGSQESVQARCTWDAVIHRSRQDALWELMTNSKTFIVTIARTSDEVVASLSQSCALQMLFILFCEAQGSASSSVDCFNLMITIAHAERRRGRETELIFRTKDGFACLLHPHRDSDMKRQWLMVSVQNHPDSVNDWLLESLDLYEKNGGLQKFQELRSENSITPFNATEGRIPLCKTAVLHSVVDFACLFELLLPTLRAWLTVCDLRYYGDIHPLLHPFIDECGVIHPTNWFQCVLHGTVRSVLLSLPNAECGATSCDDPRGMLSTARRRLACITLRRHVFFSAVWQPNLHAVKVVLSNEHVLHHIELLDGVLLDRHGLAVTEFLSPDSLSKIELLDEDSTQNRCRFSRGTCATAGGSVAAAAGFSGNTDTTSSLAFQVLSTALQRSWVVVGMALSLRISFDEDAFMDTVLRWAYALPRTIVLFYMDYPPGQEPSIHLSTGFLEAFAPVTGLKNAIEGVSANP